jgi:hypothetical protein
MEGGDFIPHPPEQSSKLLRCSVCLLLLQKSVSSWPIFKIGTFQPGIGGCNPSYFGGWEQEDDSARPVLAGTSRDPTSTNSWAQWHTLVLPATVRSINRRIKVQVSLGKKWDPILKTTKEEKGWRCGSSGRAPALHTPSPEFKPQYYQK